MVGLSFWVSSGASTRSCVPCAPTCSILLVYGTIDESKESSITSICMSEIWFPAASSSKGLFNEHDSEPSLFEDKFLFWKRVNNFSNFLSASHFSKALVSVLLSAVFFVAYY